MKKKYGRLIDTATDQSGNLIHLYMNSSKHITNRHNKMMLWIKHWKNVIESVKPYKKHGALIYTKMVNGHTMEIIVVTIENQYLIKTAIICKGLIKGFRRI